jgi:hypothetical protein
MPPFAALLRLEEGLLVVIATAADGDTVITDVDRVLETSELLETYEVLLIVFDVCDDTEVKLDNADEETGVEAEDAWRTRKPGLDRSPLFWL